MIKNTLLAILCALLIGSAILVFVITRDGVVFTPQGAGTVTIDAGTFEAFPLPDYAAKFTTPDYKSYLIEVDPGMKIHML